MNYLAFLHTFVAPAGVSAIVAALVAFLVKQAGPVATQDGKFLAAATLGFVAKDVPASFRPAVQAELATLAGDADVATATVTQAAAKILARIAPSFPQASLADVAAVVGDFTHAFVAGLVPAA